ncbi:MAG: N-acetyltransferase, partial [Oxalobacteraceae bacterium]
MLTTPRLTLIPLTLPELRLHIADSYRLEQALHLKTGPRAVTEPLLSIIRAYTIPRLLDSRYDPLYHTIW